MAKTKPTMVASNPFESWFDFEVYKPIYDFDVKVAICPKTPPRDPMFEYMIYMGRGDMERLFVERKPLKTANALWVFPENWLTQHEQRALMFVVDECGLRGELQSLMMITQSPLIASSFTRDHIRIVSTVSDVDVSWWDKKPDS